MPSAPMGPPGKPVDVAKLDPAFVAESNTAMIMAITGAFHFLALVVVALRTYTRAFMIRAIGRDDWTMLLAAGIAVGQYAIWIIEAQHGLGRHQKVIPMPELIAIKHAGFYQVLLNFCDLALIKMSIAFALMRLTKARWVSWTLWCLIVFIIAYTIMAALTTFLRCQPMAGFWDQTIAAKCYPMKLFVQFALINTGFNIFTNVALATLPIPIIWSLQMKTSTRLYIVGILSLGWVAVAVGLVKSVHQVNAAKETDGTFYQSIQFYGYLESQLGIIAASAPALKPLLNKLLGREDTTYGAGASPAAGYYAKSSSGRSKHFNGTTRSSHIYVSSQTGVDQFEMHVRPHDGSGGTQSNIYHDKSRLVGDDHHHELNLARNQGPQRSPSGRILKKTEVVQVTETSIIQPKYRDDGRFSTRNCLDRRNFGS
ncbi:hypothetical protein PG984_004079 [Apiospora sp. TS-2023a]